ncbi:hypothetical protein CBF23_003480 [Marinomonas agarivorans]|nr:hypothetical protein CBF23_003480 [Marinomonas agarivorans]
MRFILLGFNLLLLSACAVKQQSEHALVIAQLSQERSALQLQYANLSNELWQRANILLDTNSAFPMKSNDAEMLRQIKQDLSYQINQAKTRLTVLNQHVSDIKTGKVRGAKITLELQKGQWLKREKQPVALVPTQRTLVAGEKAIWELFAHLQPSSTTGASATTHSAISSTVSSSAVSSTASNAIPKIEVILSQKGQLYIDGQKVASIALDKTTELNLRDVAVFAQQPFALGHLNLILKTYADR